MAIEPWPTATSSPGDSTDTSSVDPADRSAEHQPSAPPLTSGAFALELIQTQIRRLGQLQGEVVADRDPEPLHQLRVSLRRLRTALEQFAPALDLPDGVHGRRIASVARRTGLCRDLDVLGQRLREQLLPRLPEAERRGLEGAMQRLSDDRAQAFATLLEALRGPRYLKLLARLNTWQKAPRFTPLGHCALLPWLYDWQAPFTGGLFLHPGWAVEDPAAESLHDLRKRIKRARYALEGLERWCTPPLRDWVKALRQAQDHLGELHDLQILHSTFTAHGTFRKSSSLPVLRAELKALEGLHWQRWRELAQRLRDDSQRRMVQRLLLELGETTAGT